MCRNELSFCIQSCNTHMQLHKHCGFNHSQRHITAKMSDFPWRKIKTVVFLGSSFCFLFCFSVFFNWRLSSDDTETGRDSWSQRDDKRDVCIAMVNRNNNIAEKEETVVKEKVGKKNQGYSTSACLSFFFFSVTASPLDNDEVPWTGSCVPTPTVLIFYAVILHTQQPCSPQTLWQNLLWLAYIHLRTACIRFWEIPSSIRALYTPASSPAECVAFIGAERRTMLVKKPSENLRHPTNWTGSLKGTYVKGSAGRGGAVGIIRGPHKTTQRESIHHGLNTFICSHTAGISPLAPSFHVDPAL